MQRFENDINTLYLSLVNYKITCLIANCYIQRLMFCKLAYILTSQSKHAYTQNKQNYFQASLITLIKL